MRGRRFWGSRLVSRAAAPRPGAGVERISGQRHAFVPHAGRVDSHFDLRRWIDRVTAHLDALPHGFEDTYGYPPTRSSASWLFEPR
jgi:hypothetical protein